MAKKTSPPILPNPAVKVACDILGSQAALAQRLDISPVTVHQWIKGVRAVPIERCVEIENATEGKVTRQDLRDDWQAIWPELVAG